MMFCQHNKTSLSVEHDKFPNPRLLNMSHTKNNRPITRRANTTNPPTPMTVKSQLLPAAATKPTVRPFTSYCKAATATRRSRAMGDNIFGYSLSPAEYQACDLRPATARPRIAADRESTAGGGDDARKQQPPHDAEMRRATSEHRQLLHDTGDRAARAHYLSARSQVVPRDKYYFPAATSWRYGWVRSADVETTPGAKGKP